MLGIDLQQGRSIQTLRSQFRLDFCTQVIITIEIIFLHTLIAVESTIHRIGIVHQRHDLHGAVVELHHRIAQTCHFWGVDMQLFKLFILTTQRARNILQ